MTSTDGNKPPLWAVIGYWQGYEAVILWHTHDDPEEDEPYGWALNIPVSHPYGSPVHGVLTQKNQQGGWVDLGQGSVALWSGCPAHLPLGEKINGHIIQEAYQHLSDQKPSKIFVNDQERGMSPLLSPESSPLWSLCLDDSPCYISRFLRHHGVLEIHTSSYDLWQKWQEKPYFFKNTTKELPQDQNPTILYKPRDYSFFSEYFDTLIQKKQIVSPGIDIIWEHTHMATCIDVNVTPSAAYHDQQKVDVWKKILVFFQKQMYGRRLSGLVYIDGPSWPRPFKNLHAQKVRQEWMDILKETIPSLRLDWTPAGIMEITLPRRWHPLVCP